MTKNKMTLWTCLLIIFVYIGMAILASFGLIASDFAATNLDLSYLEPSSNHWMGTDFLGRDVLSRAIHGSKIALLIGLFSASITTLIGVSLGGLAGFYGGWLDRGVTWLYSTIESIPYVLLISGFSFVLGPGITNLFLALGLTGWVRLCRLTRAEVLKIRQQSYVSSARAIGSSQLSILLKHILPNTRHLALVEFGLAFIYAIKIEAILSFLGLGVEPGTPSWGTMINDAKVELTQGVWWNLTCASLFMFVLILAVNIFVENLRVKFDPKLNSNRMSL